MKFMNIPQEYLTAKFVKAEKRFNECSKGNNGAIGNACKSCSVKKACLKYWDTVVANGRVRGFGRKAHIAHNLIGTRKDLKVSSIFKIAEQKYQLLLKNDKQNSINIVSGN